MRIADTVGGIVVLTNLEPGGDLDDQTLIGDEFVLRVKTTTSSGEAVPLCLVVAEVVAKEKGANALLSESTFQTNEDGIGVLVTKLTTGRDGEYAFRFRSGKYVSQVTSSIRFVNPIGKVTLLNSPCEGGASSCAFQFLTYPGRAKFEQFRVEIEQNCVLMEQPECEHNDDRLMSTAKAAGRREGEATTGLPLPQELISQLPGVDAAVAETLKSAMQANKTAAFAAIREKAAGSKKPLPTGTYCPCFGTLTRGLNSDSFETPMDMETLPSAIETKAFQWVEKAISNQFLSSDVTEGLVSAAKAKLKPPKKQSVSKLLNTDVQNIDSPSGCDCPADASESPCKCTYVLGKVAAKAGESGLQAVFQKKGDYSMYIVVNGVSSGYAVKFEVRQYPPTQAFFKKWVRSSILAAVCR
jgi:hypothetical protein